MLVEQLSNERGAATGGRQDEDVSLPGGIVIKIWVLITYVIEGLHILPQATVQRVRNRAHMKRLSCESPDCCVLDRYGHQCKQNHSLPGTLHGWVTSFR